MPIPHPNPLSGSDYSAVELAPDDDRVVMLDQRLLPDREVYLEFTRAEEVAQAIGDMVVRGAPAIGIAAAYAVVLAATRGEPLEGAARMLKATRPTAVNLAWAVERMLEAAARSGGVDRGALAKEARAIHAEDVAACRRIGQLGIACLGAGATVLTHCNAGALATGGYGTALGVIRAGHAAGRIQRVLADETRPYLQGARLTAWELSREGIPVDVLVDSAAAQSIGRYAVGSIIVGADRIAANGDVANKIGTFGLAIAARHHGCRFLVAAPWSTVDLGCPDGGSIPIEERSELEMRQWAGRRLVPERSGVLNPAFDVTPAGLIDAIITERGIVSPPSVEGLAALARV